jgi:hypothetical protein
LFLFPAEHLFHLQRHYGADQATALMGISFRIRTRL